MYSPQNIKPVLFQVDKGNQIDIIQQKHIRSINGWDGTCSKDGRYGLFAPSTGGMEMLDLRSGKVCKTLIPKVAEGIFDVLAVFNATNEYILYYHRYIHIQAGRIYRFD